ncbi:beta-N-acetylhexosaminidase [Spirilliplanes yamanashiensis]|nr:beta-N-acetylhexosaminidase [Spirilliplanes yamanashiensis]MDP9816993.1 hexosaminidase [Spirilliplanes yamanashiensis]
MLVPSPRALTPQTGHFVLTADTALAAPAGVADLVRELLGPATGLPLPDAAAPGPGVIALTVADEPTLGPEGYRLSVTPEGVTAVAHTEAGLRWAVQTLRQLLPAAVFGAAPAPGAEWRVAAAEIEDVPAYAWRGALLDVARWCHPIGFVRRFVDLMAAHKLNTLHLHLTDDQGWRFQVRKYPRLTEVGAYRTESSAGHANEDRRDGVPHGGFYTQDELRDLVAYAARRGVRIMPELDLPGHMQAAIAAYPELGNHPDRQLGVMTYWGISEHVLNNSDATLGVMKDVLDELVEIFPFEIVHIGGDECPTVEWQESEVAQARVRELGLTGVDQLQGWWAAEMAKHLAGHGRRIAVWDELLERGVQSDAVIFGWQGEERVHAALAAGHEVVAAPHTHTYLDYAESDSPDEPLAIRGTTPIEKVYGYRPTPDGLADGPGRVLGVQAQVWSEYVPTPELVEYRTYPRLAALAEVGWSGEGGDVADFRTRLAEHIARLDAAGVNYRPLD